MKYAFGKNRNYLMILHRFDSYARQGNNMVLRKVRALSKSVSGGR